MAQRRAACHGDEFLQITPRQAEILEMVLAGKCRKEISAVLHIEPRTVTYHLGSLHRCLGTHTREEIIARLFRAKVTWEVREGIRLFVVSEVYSHSKCGVYGCNRTIWGRTHGALGMCGAHYHRYRQGERYMKVTKYVGLTSKEKVAMKIEKLGKQLLVAAIILFCIGNLCAETLFALAVPQVTSHSVAMSWNAPTGVVTGYNVYRRAGTGAYGAKLNAALVTGLTYTDLTVQAGAAYFYIVRSVDAAGTESLNSNEVTATIPDAPAITTTSPLPGGVVGVAYSATFAATGSTPIAWTSDAAVPGLVFNAATPVLAGTPTAVGMYSFNVTATNSLGSQSASYLITVANPPPPSTTSIFGNQTTGNTTDSADSNALMAARFTSGPAGGAAVSISAYVATPLSASPNNQFQAAIYADSAGKPGNLIAKSASKALAGNSWNTVPISANIVANTPYWLVYNTNGTSTSANNIRLSSGGTSSWRSGVAFNTWPNPFGTVQGTAAGTVTMYLTYSTVAPAVSVVVSPKTATVAVNSAQQFSATVLNTPKTAVTWSADCGSVDSAGLYMAPASAGTCRVTATSVADVTRSDSATVTVNPPPPTLSVDCSKLLDAFTAANIPSGTVLSITGVAAGVQTSCMIPLP